MKLSVWVSVSDLLPVKLALIERINNTFDHKHADFIKRTPQKMFLALKKSGIEGIELSLTKDTSRKNLQEIKDLLAENKMQVLSIHQPLSFKTADLLLEIEKLSAVAKDFSARIVVLHANAIAGKLLDKAWNSKLLNLQKKYAVTFGVENMDKQIFRSKPSTYDSEVFSSVIKKSGLSITFDITHLAQTGEDVLSFYSNNKDKIVNVHLSDCRKDFINTYFITQINTHLAVGEGNLQITQLLKMLKQQKYKGLITMEINANLNKLCRGAEYIKKNLL